MKKIVLLTLGAVATLLSCSDKGPLSVSGTIVEASMNTVAIVTDNSSDTLYFSTIDADKSGAQGMLEAEQVEIFYAGELNKTGQGEITSAMKVVYLTPPLIGSWLQPITGLEGVQGINIELGGGASSINMATLVYKSWARSGDTLVLAAQSIGNGQSFEFTESWLISTLSADSLVLNSVGNPSMQQAYTRSQVDAAKP